MYFFDRFNADNLFSLNFDGVNLNSSIFALDMAPEANSFIELNPDSTPVNAPTPLGPLHATVNGTAGDDVLNGTADDDTINGFGGNDTLDGGTGDGNASDGNDIINGGEGDDTIVYSATGTNSGNIDTNDGGTGNDTFLVTSLSAGSTWAVDLTAGEFTFGTFGGTVRGTLTNIENVTYTGEGDFDIRGDGGENILTVTGDTINIIEGLGGNDTINAGGGQDIVDAGSGNDLIIDDNGWPGDGSEDDSYDGGSGVDTIDIAQGSGTVSDAVTVNLATGFIVAFGSDRDSLTNIENVTVDGDGNITGDAFNNVLTALGTGDNAISGGAGNDTINGGLGTDDLDGGDGDDTFIIDQTGEYFGDWNGGAGTDRLRIEGIGTFDLYDSAENMDFGSIEEIEFGATGPSGTRILQISGEEISGTEISDTALIDGYDGGGADIVEIFMGSASSLDISGWTFQDWNISEGDLIRIMGDGANETIIGTTEDDEINGNGGNDNLNGTSGVDLINAGDGDDTVTDDELFGAVHSGDVYDGGTGTDTLVYTASGGFLIVVNMTTGEVTNNGGVIDTFSNFENVTVAASIGVIGDANANVITGGTGDNNIAGLGGADTMDGGDGRDVLDYSASGAAVTVDLNANTASGGHADGDVISNFESLEGSAFNDTLTSSLFFGVINGNGGDDIINLAGGLDGSNLNGGDGNDIITSAVSMNGSSLDGGAGNDELYLYTDSGLVGAADVGDGGAGDDIIGFRAEIFDQDADGGSGTDTLTLAALSGGYTIDMVAGGVDDGDGLNNATFQDIENIIGSSGADIITGDAGNNELMGGAGDDVINGGDGNDIIDGGAGGDSINGGAGDDILIWVEPEANFSDSVDGGTGNDTMVTIGYAFGDLGGGTFNLGAGIFEISGSSLALTNIENYDGSGNSDSAENVIGTSGANIITMGAGNNRVEGGAGADTMDGGDGTDTLSYASSGSAVTVNLGAGTASGGDATGDIFMNFENIYGSQSNDILTGDAFANTLEGDLGNDRLDGGAGDDMLIGGEGSDTLFGGAGADVNDGGNGFDIVDYSNASSRVVFNAITGGTLGDALGDTYIGIERYRGSDFNDSITGTAGNEFFFGGDGNDIINGGDGIDRIYGEGGNDVQRGDGGNDLLFGSAGSDQLNGGTGFDIATYAEATSHVVVNLATGGTVGDAAGDTYFGIEAVYGSAFNDNITGSSGSNELRGLDGDDTLIGGAGNDRLFGGNGADFLVGGTGVDIAMYTVATSGVTVNLSSSGTVGEAAGDTYSSIEWVFGSDHNDIITGDSAGNRLEGNVGNDTLNGGAGNDRLLGGDGNDIINGGDGVDTIFGQGGNDTLAGAGGNDFFFGSSGGDSMNGGLDFDTVSYLASSSAVDVNLQTGGTAGDANGDTYSSIERLLGTQFDDALRGSNGDNTLLGNGGNDYLEGGLGNDTLVGGAGTDSYGYNTTNGDADAINGFSTSGELIYILGGDTDFDTWAEVQAVGSDAAANVIFNFGGGNTLTIIGQNLADLDASDFDFSGVPPAAEMLDDSDAFASEPLSFDEIVAIHQEFAANSEALNVEDAFM